MSVVQDNAEPISVGLLGVGATGRAIGERLIARDDVHVTVAVDRDTELAGTAVAGTDGKGGTVSIVADADTLLKSGVDLAVVTTTSTVRELETVVVPLLNAGINVLSLCEELAYPWVSDPDTAGRLDAAARAGNVSILGTGCNPGFVSDTLPLVLTGSLPMVESISIIRTANVWHFGPLLEKFGFGLSEEEHRRRAGEDVVGHVGFAQSLSMVCHYLGLEPDKIEVDPPTPLIVADSERKGPYVTVPEGGVAAVRQFARATNGGTPMMEFDGRFGFFVDGDDLEPDRLTIRSADRTLDVAADPGFDSWDTTISVAVNCTRGVVTAKPGLICMADMPIADLAARAGSLTPQGSIGAAKGTG